MKLLDALFRTNGHVPAVAALTRKSHAPREKTRQRDEQVKARYLAGENTPALADAFGLSRERICQILRRDDLIDAKAERRRLGKELVLENIEAVKAENAARLQEKLERGISLVRAGSSYRAAAIAVDGACYSYFANLLAASCKKAGIKNNHGRHDRDYTWRRERVRQLAAEGYTINRTVEIMRGEGDRIFSNWIYEHCKDVQFTKRRRRQKPALPAKAGPPAFEWSEERITDLRRHWLNGLSAQQIADIFGCTRNTVIGKVNRLRSNGGLRVTAQVEATDAPPS